MKTGGGFTRGKLWLIALSMLLLLFGTAANADIFYTVSNYSSGSVGTIRSQGGSAVVNKNLVNNLGGDSFGFTYVDEEGKAVGLIREYNYGPDDHIMLYDPNAPSTPLWDGRGWISNVHGIASDSTHLYLNSYESYVNNAGDQMPGEIVKIRMGKGADGKPNYVVAKRYVAKAYRLDGVDWQPHGEGLMRVGDYLYALWSISDSGPSDYQPSELWKMTTDLEVVGKAKVGKNTGNLSSGNMAFHNGKIFVCAMGGMQGMGFPGDIYMVDVETMASKKVFETAVGMYGIAITPDGTAFILAGGYDESFSFTSTVYKTTADRLTQGNLAISDLDVVHVPGDGGGGYSWSLLYDKNMERLWMMGGNDLLMFDKNGRLLETFTPNELGDNIYSISVIGGGGLIPWMPGSDLTPADPIPTDPTPTDPADPGADDPEDNPDPIDHDDENEVTIPLPIDNSVGSAAEVLATAVYAPELTAAEISEIQSVVGSGVNVVSLKDDSTALVTVSRETAASLLTENGENMINTLFVSSSTSGAVVYRPKFTLNSRSNTYGGEPVPVPQNVSAFNQAMGLQFIFDDGSAVNINETTFPGVVHFGSTARSIRMAVPTRTAEETVHSLAVITLSPHFVAVDGTAPSNATWTDGSGAGILSAGEYLYVFDGIADGRTEFVTTIMKKATASAPGDPTPTPDDPNPSPDDPNPTTPGTSGGGGGGGCSAGASGMGLFILAIIAVFAGRRKIRVAR